MIFVMVLPWLVNYMEVADGPHVQMINMPHHYQCHGSKSLNRHYILQRLNHPRIDKHADTMLKELIEELRLGRMGGLFWLPLGGLATQQSSLIATIFLCQMMRFLHLFVLASNKVTKSDAVKISSTAFWTVQYVYTIPPHHDDLSVFVELIRAHFDLQIQAQAWAQDLDGAYRQFPLRDPRDGFCILQLGHPLLLQHHALSFGAVSSVWGFNRAADALCFLARRIFQICVVILLTILLVLKIPRPFIAALMRLARFSDALASTWKTRNPLRRVPIRRF